MGGLANICKMYGRLEVKGKDGKKVTWVYDYANDKPRIKGEMTPEEEANSERAKWMSLSDDVHK